MATAGKAAQTSPNCSSSHTRLGQTWGSGNSQNGDGEAGEELGPAAAAPGPWRGAQDGFWDSSASPGGSGTARAPQGMAQPHRDAWGDLGVCAAGLDDPGGSLPTQAIL